MLQLLIDASSNLSLLDGDSLAYEVVLDSAACVFQSNVLVRVVPAYADFDKTFLKFH